MTRTDLAADLAAERASLAAERHRTELADQRAHRHDRAAARVRTAVELGADAATAERQRRAAAAMVPADHGARADREEDAHGRDHEPDARPHACPLCAEDTGDPFGMFVPRTIAETVAALVELAEEAATESVRGRCDTCGAPCADDTGECTRDRTHAVALD